MSHTRLLAAALTAIALGFAPLVPVTYASDEVVRTSGNISSVSGGIGTASIDRLGALAGTFNLKLVFAMKSGDYLSGVRVSIADMTGKSLLNTTSEGPVFLIRVPAGNYQVVATYAGKAETRAIRVDLRKLSTIDFRWATEERLKVISAQ